MGTCSNARIHLLTRLLNAILATFLTKTLRSKESS